MALAAVLHMRPSEYLSRHLSPSGQPFDRLIAGAIIFHPIRKNPPEILLVKRPASQGYDPDVYEIPASHIQRTDPTIFHGLLDRIRNDTGLRINDIKGRLRPIVEEEGEKVVRATDGDVLVTTFTQVLLFVCSIAVRFPFRLNGDVYSEAVWVTREEAEKMDLSEEIWALAEEAFEWWDKDEEEKLYV